MGKELIIFVVLMVGIGVASANIEIGGIDNGYGVVDLETPESPINYSYVTVNASEIWITNEGDMDNVPDLYPTLDGRYAQPSDINGSFNQTLTDSIYVEIAGDTMTGDLELNGGDLILNEGDDIHWNDVGQTQQQRLIQYDISWDVDAPFNIRSFYNTVEDGTSPLIIRGEYLYMGDFSANQLTSGVYQSIGHLVQSEYADLIEDGSTTRTYQGYAHTVGNIFDIGGTGDINTVGYSASAGNLLNFGSGQFTGVGYKTTGFGHSTLDVGQSYYSDGGDFVLEHDNSAGNLLFGASNDVEYGYDGGASTMVSNAVTSSRFNWTNFIEYNFDSRVNVVNLTASNTVETQEFIYPDYISAVAVTATSGVKNGKKNPFLNANWTTTLYVNNISRKGITLDQSTGAFEVQKAGVYSISYDIITEHSASKQLDNSILVNGVEVFQNRDFIHSSVDPHITNIEIIKELNAYDNVSLENDPSTTTNWWYHNGTIFNMRLISSS